MMGDDLSRGPDDFGAGPEALTLERVRRKLAELLQPPPEGAESSASVDDAGGKEAM
jgi:hypothetical protein